MSKRTYYKRDKLGRFAKEDYSGLSADELAKKVQFEISEDNDVKIVTPITDEAIERVPVVNIPGYTQEECEKLREYHREVLKRSRATNNHGEFGILLDKNLNEVYSIKGNEVELEIPNLRVFGDGILILHNHPANSSFSTKDIETFIEADEIKTMSIVKNSGNVEIITKTPNFEKQRAITSYLRNLKKYLKIKTKSNFDRAIERTLSDEKVGIIWKKS